MLSAQQLTKTYKENNIPEFAKDIDVLLNDKNNSDEIEAV